jgi:hypothetical protein
MKKYQKISILGFALLISVAGFSQTNATIFSMEPDRYPSSEYLEFKNLVCDVQNVYQFENDSSLAKVSNETSISHKFFEFIGLYKNSIYGQFIGQKFILNRYTGKYKFKDFGNDGYINTVIDVGSTKQSYKVISTTSGGYVHTQYIQVDVYQKNGDMNFRIMDSDILFTGNCQLG